MSIKTIYIFLAAMTGAFIALQASANGKFRHNLGNPWWPAFLSICGTIITAILLMAIFRPEVPSAEAFKSTQWWNWIGGPLGAMIVLSGAALSRELGAGAFIALVVGGQMICAVLLDHFALMGLPEVRITWGRALGVVLLIAGVCCIKYL
jgi:bacterial/archaeal transporter family-2 protein